MSDDLAKRLNSTEFTPEELPKAYDLMYEAADRIEELEEAIITTEDNAESEQRELDLVNEISRLDAVIERLGERKYLYENNEIRMRGIDADWSAECEARIQYARDNRKQSNGVEL